MLVRSAFSANIKERRDCSTALFDERGPDGRAGRAHPRPPRRDARGGRGRHAPATRSRARSTSSTTRTPAARTCRTSRSSRATALGFAVSRAHHADVGGMEPASLPGGSRELYQEGWSSRRSRLDDEVLTLLPRERAQPGRAARRPARADRGAPARRAAARRAVRAPRARHASRPRWTSSTRYSERVVRAAIAALPDGRYEAADVLEAVERRARDPRRGHDRGRRGRDRLRRHRRRSTRGTSTARSRSPARPATSSSAA